MADQDNSKENHTVGSRGKENNDQNHCHDDIDEYVDSNEKKKKGEKLDLSTCIL